MPLGVVEGVRTYNRSRRNQPPPPPPPTSIISQPASFLPFLLHDSPVRAFVLASIARNSGVCGCGDPLRRWNSIPYHITPSFASSASTQQQNLLLLQYTAGTMYWHTTAAPSRVLHLQRPRTADACMCPAGTMPPVPGPTVGRRSVAGEKTSLSLLVARPTPSITAVVAFQAFFLLRPSPLQYCSDHCNNSRGTDGTYNTYIYILQKSGSSWKGEK